jgi:hypothetical protein
MQATVARQRREGWLPADTPVRKDGGVMLSSTSCVSSLVILPTKANANDSRQDAKTAAAAFIFGMERQLASEAVLV